MYGQRIGYIRVSTVEQNPERQLEHVAVDRLFTDKASGKATQRPALDALLAFVRDGDTVVVHSMDRLARNLDDLRRLVQQLTRRGIAIHFAKENLTFTGEDSPVAHLMLEEASLPQCRKHRPSPQRRPVKRRLQNVRSCTSILRVIPPPEIRYNTSYFTTAERGGTMVSDGFFYELLLWRLLWRYVMLLWAWPLARVLPSLTPPPRATGSYPSRAIAPAAAGPAGWCWVTGSRLRSRWRGSALMVSARIVLCVWASPRLPRGGASFRA